MLLLDLRWVVFLLLLAAVVIVLLTIRLARWRRGERQVLPLPPEGVHTVLERASFGWLVLDGPRSYCYANPYARRLLALTSPAGSLPEATWVSLMEEDRRAARGEAGAMGHYRSVSLSEEQVVRWWVTPWKEMDVVVSMEATAQRRAEQAASYLLSALSHELRTPIGTILTHLEILLLPDISEEIRRQSLHLLQTEIRRMARLVNQMLELGRLETDAETERRPVDLLALVEQAIAQSAPQAEGGEIALSLQAETPLPLVVGQEDRLLQVFINLLDNGIKYSRPGDRVVVSLGRVEEGIECVVRDTGPGISVEHLPHVTRRFYRAAPRKIEGSGLGLALVEEILRRHQSRLELQSRADGGETGTRARFVLPILPE